MWVRAAVMKHWGHTGLCTVPFWRSCCCCCWETAWRQTDDIIRGKDIFHSRRFLHVIAENTQVCLIINSDDAPLRGAVVSWACCWVDRLTGSGRTGTLDGTGPSQAEVLPALTAQNVCREKSSVVLFYIKHVKGSQRRWKYFSITIFFFMEMESWFVETIEPTELFVFLPWLSDNFFSISCRVNEK